MVSVSQQDIMKYVVRLVIIFLILPLHEYAHAWAAHKLGDDTASYQGRMTLNPLAHIDPIGALCLFLTGYGWAKPVPISPSRFDRKHNIRAGVALTALAGPMANLLSALVGMIFLQIYQCTDMYNTFMEDSAVGEAVSNVPFIIYTMLYYFISINIGLAVFNLVPIPPLDGSKIASYFTSGKFDAWFYKNQMIVQIVFMVIVFTGILSLPLTIAGNGVWWFLDLITSWIPKLFG